MGAIVSLATALLEQKAAGSVVGLLASKTVGAATVSGLAGLWSLIPGIAAKDPQAIGNAALIIAGWIGTLYGRWRAGKARA
jgi:hypothetical protein